jgi:hypothetical protein
MHLLWWPEVLLMSASTLRCAQVIAEALQFNQALVSIDLGYNALGAGGGAYLGEVLYDNRCALAVN